ncbi:thiolase family protein [Allopusillimonas soli]|uniref:Thiolase family protein n=1 Tax=Allopusillimonas soli TaxID=659016 RepID=A0A853F8T7_9BURK|nr:thiolase family protein [Allopusillimonas soli]NYT36397.1 thiolase family protein [Allopusillimonas soli]TEA74910.1 thiolase family protein [Allopusillimonas soli]
MNRDTSGISAVVGVGHTDWAEDYRRVRKGEKPHDSNGYATLAFNRALQDAGIDRDDIDGLIVGPTTAYERMGEILNINPRWGGQADAIQAVLQAVLAINAGMAEVVALVYGNDQRSAAVQYGGPEAMGGGSFLSYVYHSPWGLTSQGALYALMYQRYKQLNGLDDSVLGQVSVAQRQWASLNPHAIMRKTISMDDYLASNYIAEPLHLYDYCLINDGGVALIIMEADRARKAAAKSGGKPVYIRGIGRADLNSKATSLGPRLLDFYLPAQQKAAKQVFDAAGIGPQDVDALMVYDSFSPHILFALEGFGYCGIGEAGEFVAQKGIGVGGKLPINTGGGHLSESYMQGWNHQVEAVRQVRGGLGERQVPNCRHVQYTSDVAGKAMSVIYGA